MIGQTVMQPKRRQNTEPLKRPGWLPRGFVPFQTITSLLTRPNWQRKPLCASIAWALLCLGSAIAQDPAAVVEPTSAASTPSSVTPSATDVNTPATTPAAEAAPAATPAAQTEPQQPQTVVAQENVPVALPTTAAQFIKIRFPLRVDVEDTLKPRLSAVVQRLRARGQRPVLVLEMTAISPEESAKTSFAEVDALAEILTSDLMQGVRTVAFLPDSLAGHSVLAALACEEIVIAPKATLGDAGLGLGQGESPSNRQLTTYAELAEKRRTVPKAVALAMLDRNQRLLQVKTQGGWEFVLEADLPALKRQTAIDGEPLVLADRGELAKFTGQRCRELGFASYLATTREEIVDALNLDPAALENNPALMGEIFPIQLSIQGTLTSENMKRIRKALQERLARKDVNFICVKIDSVGGDIPAALDLANDLARLDSDEIFTVAYIPDQALASSFLIALGCQELVVGPEAKLGGQGEVQMDQQELASAIPTLRELAKLRERTWSLFAATQVPNFAVYKCRRLGTSQQAYFSEKELSPRADVAEWERGEPVTVVGEQLQMSSKQALEWGLTEREFAADVSAFEQIYGIKNGMQTVEPGWAVVLLETLASRPLGFLLLMIGFAALMAELQTPGIGAGGIIATLCFLLFFWAHYLDGTALWLEALLFLVGVLCILIELFVVPGTTGFGIGGGLLILISLVLASQTGVLPQNTFQLERFRNTLVTLLGSIVGSICLALAFNRLLPYTPFGRVILSQSEAEKLEISQRESLAEWYHLLGQVGETTTVLRPSGKAKFGDEWVDVISRGEAIDSGQPVEVVEVLGSRVIVRQIAKS